MALWGAGTGGDEAKPKWLTAEQKKNTFADNRGWVYKDPNTGLEEVLVAIRGLAGATKLAAPTVATVGFNPDEVAQGTELVLLVNYNEPVTVSGNPTISVTGGTGTLTYDSANSDVTTGELAFIMDTTSQSGTVTLAESESISLAGGSITDATDGSTPAELTLNNSELVATITV